MGNYQGVFKGIVGNPLIGVTARIKEIETSARGARAPMELVTPIKKIILGVTNYERKRIIRQKFF